MKLLKFSASWCGPCKMLTKVMESIKFPYEVVDVDIEGNEELVAKYGVRGVPTLVLLDDKEDVVVVHIGALDKTALEERFINL
jgi:thioredoxin 1